MEKKDAQELEQREILRNTLNNGLHLFVEDSVDFWPSTGKWIVRGGKSGRGVINLIKEIQKHEQ